MLLKILPMVQILPRVYEIIYNKFKNNKYTAENSTDGSNPS